MTATRRAPKSAPPLRVVCAIIEDHGRVLAAKRSSSMHLPLRWEFPGGKLHAGETPEDGIVREIREELGLDVEPIARLAATTHRYPAFVIELIPLICRVSAGTLTLHEHCAAGWFLPDGMGGLAWAPADVPVLSAYVLWRREGAVALDRPKKNAYGTESALLN